MKSKSEDQNADNQRTASTGIATGLIVLGMHRSGTSTLTGTLRLCGAWSGEKHELVRANPRNPKGFWERRDIRKICDQLLYSAKADWWNVSEFQTSAIAESALEYQGRKFREIVGKLATHGTWVLKEPRLCLLFPVLRPLIENPVCIHISRNPLSVARSLQKRNGFGIAEGIALWEKYVVSALTAAEGLPQALVSYEDLVAAPRKTLSALLGRLKKLSVTGLAMPEAGKLEEFVTPRLQHQRATPEDAGTFLSKAQFELWARLNSGKIPDKRELGGLSQASIQLLRDLERRQQSAKDLLAQQKALKTKIRRIKEKGRLS